MVGHARDGALGLALVEYADGIQADSLSTMRKVLDKTDERLDKALDAPLLIATREAHP